MSPEVPPIITLFVALFAFLSASSVALVGIAGMWLQDHLRKSAAASDMNCALELGFTQTGSRFTQTGSRLSRTWCGREVQIWPGASGYNIAMQASFDGLNVWRRSKYGYDVGAFASRWGSRDPSNPDKASVARLHSGVRNGLEQVVAVGSSALINSGRITVTGVEIDEADALANALNRMVPLAEALEAPVLGLRDAVEAESDPAVHAEGIVELIQSGLMVDEAMIRKALPWALEEDAFRVLARAMSNDDIAHGLAIMFHREGLGPKMVASRLCKTWAGSGVGRWALDVLVDWPIDGTSQERSIGTRLVDGIGHAAEEGDVPTLLRLLDANHVAPKVLRWIGQLASVDVIPELTHRQKALGMLDTNLDQAYTSAIRSIQARAAGGRGDVSIAGSADVGGVALADDDAAERVRARAAASRKRDTNRS